MLPTSQPTDGWMDKAGCRVIEPTIYKIGKKKLWWKTLVENVEE